MSDTILVILEYHDFNLIHNRHLLEKKILNIKVHYEGLRKLVPHVVKAGIQQRQLLISFSLALNINMVKVFLPAIEWTILSPFHIVEVIRGHPLQYLIQFIVNVIWTQISK